MRTPLSFTRAVALSIVLASSLLATGLNAAPARAAIVAHKVRGGLNDPAGFTFSPKGLIYYLERGTGQVRVLNPKTGSTRLFFHLSGVNGQGERGALGIALHPDFPRKPFVYVYVTRSTGGHLRNEVVRLRMHDGHGTGLRILLKSPASSDPYHNGGRIFFGPDGKLYVIVGDGHDSRNAQDRTKNLRGKILRIKPDGSIPKTNPFPASRIWAYGIRNSFGFTFDARTGRLWETENGPECNDEINLILKGGNFGWGPNENCSGTSPQDTNNSGPTPRHLPKTFFVNTLGITGDAFCHGCELGATVDGDLFFGDVNNGKVYRVALNAARNDTNGAPVTVLSAPGGNVFSMETGPGGKIYFSDASAIYRLVHR